MSLKYFPFEQVSDDLIQEARELSAGIERIAATFPDSQGYMALEKDKFRGFILYGTGSIVNTRGTFVHPEFRRQGIASNMWNYFLHYVQSLGYETVRTDELLNSMNTLLHKVATSNPQWKFTEDGLPYYGWSIWIDMTSSPH